jgi:hypothetical protein
VTLVPRKAPWAASFYDSPEQPIAVYVDLTTPAVWSGSTVTIVDSDLDVILRRRAVVGRSSLAGRTRRNCSE